MVNMRTKNMRFLKLLDINGGKEYICIIINNNKFLTYP
jgi:hypothetical protein